MKTVDLSYGGHRWEKQNLMTLGKTRTYDLYKCACCSIEGKSYRLGYITVPERYAKKLDKCKTKKNHVQLKVIRCGAFGPEFANLTPGSIHDIIKPPEGESNDLGEWVQETTEPVLLLAGEYGLSINSKRIKD